MQKDRQDAIEEEAKNNIKNIKAEYEAREKARKKLEDENTVSINSSTGKKPDTGIIKTVDFGDEFWRIGEDAANDLTSSLEQNLSDAEMMGIKNTITKNRRRV